MVPFAKGPSYNRPNLRLSPRTHVQISLQIYIADLHSEQEVPPCTSVADNLFALSISTMRTSFSSGETGAAFLEFSKTAGPAGLAHCPLIDKAAS